MTTIQFKRGLADNIDAVVLELGEPAYCSDSYEFRIGDGVTEGGVVVGGAAHVVRSATARDILDLSEAAVSDNIILHFSSAATLVSIRALYTEASSEDEGVAIAVGTQDDEDYYYTGVSETEKEQWSYSDLVPLQDDIPAGTTVVCSCAGSKVGDGNVLIIIGYVLD